MFGFRTIAGFILIFLLMLCGCKNNRVPKGFPNPNKMAEMLTDILILESTMQYGRDYQISTKDSYGYYRNALAKYGYTYEEYDSIRKWYVANTSLYQKVYEKVIINLSKRDTEIGLLLDKEKEELKKQDSLLSTERAKSELWKLADTIVVSPTDTIDKRIPFTIYADTLDLSGMLRLSAQYKFLNNDESKKPQMMLNVLYIDTTSDTLYKDIPHSFQQKTAILDLFLYENKKVTKINGYLLWQDSLINASVEINSISLRIFKDSINSAINRELDEQHISRNKERNRLKQLKSNNDIKSKKEITSP
jgi:hypothetical protein